jgi:hypothetical protein
MLAYRQLNKRVRLSSDQGLCARQGIAWVLERTRTYGFISGEYT